MVSNRVISLTVNRQSSRAQSCVHLIAQHAVTTDCEFSSLNVSLAEKKLKKVKKKQRRLVQPKMLTSLPEDKCE